MNPVALVSDLADAADARECPPSRYEAEQAVRTLLRHIGENPAREGLLDTPKRVAKAYGEFFSGYSQDPDEVLERTFKDVGGYKDAVLVKDIPFFSHCEHHMVPFFDGRTLPIIPLTAS